MPNGLYLPGISGNYASTPDSVATSITGSIDIRCRVALDDWTPAVNATIIAKYDTAGNQRSYRLQIQNTSGEPRFLISADGIALVNVGANASPSVSDGNKLWLRVTFDATSGDVTFYTGGEGLTPTWVQLGDVAASGINSLFDNTIALEVGSNAAGTNSLAIGTFYRAQVLNGINGTLVFDADFTDLTVAEVQAAAFIEDSTEAATVTLNGNDWIYVRPSGDGLLLLEVG
jgi:hypothetical protein